MKSSRILLSAVLTAGLASYTFAESTAGGGSSGGQTGAGISGNSSGAGGAGTSGSGSSSGMGSGGDVGPITTPGRTPDGGVIDERPGQDLGTPGTPDRPATRPAGGLDNRAPSGTGTLPPSDTPAGTGIDTRTAPGGVNTLPEPAGGEPGMPSR